MTRKFDNTRYSFLASSEPLAAEWPDRLREHGYSVDRIAPIAPSVRKDAEKALGMTLPSDNSGTTWQLRRGNSNLRIWSGFRPEFGTFVIQVDRGNEQLEDAAIRDLESIGAKELSWNDIEPLLRRTKEA